MAKHIGILALRDNFASERGKQCAVIAATIAGTASKAKLEDVKEARQWVSLGLAFDKAAKDGVIEDLEKALERKKSAAEGRGRLKGNVLPLQ
ncbi:MAG: hypothetical protein AAF721_00370 [Myxococcota bacterium]